MSHSVLLVTDEQMTVQAVTSALQSNGRLQGGDVCRDLTEVGLRLSQASVSAVLVDIDAQPARAMATLDNLVRRHPETRFIVLANRMEPQQMLEAMQSGARHFMTKNDVATSLCSVIRRLCQPAHAPEGKVISIFSASGGCGATTIAVNLANELQLAADQGSLLVDLDYAYGAVGQYLGVEGTYGVMDLQERPGPIDPELISTSAAAYGARMKVLASATPGRLGMGGNYERLADTIHACARASGLVVVDAPRLPLDVAAELAKISSSNFLVMQLNVKDVRTARSMMSALSARGVSGEAFTLLVNRYRRRSTTLEIEEARRALEGYRVECLSNDFQAASESINFGQPMEKTSPRSAFRREIQLLAGRLASAKAPVNGVHV